MDDIFAEYEKQQKENALVDAIEYVFEEWDKEFYDYSTLRDRMNELRAALAEFQKPIELRG